MRTRNSAEEPVRLSLAAIDSLFSLYVHIPFCLRKCPYCSFYSLPLRRGEEERYLSLLEREILSVFPSLGPQARADTIYIGGGTPTVLTIDQWERLLAHMKRHVPMSAAPEFTVEANPESLTAEVLALWKNWGVTRVSLGVQSFSDGELRFLHRPHSADKARWALSAASNTGFSTSADFIFGLAGQTLRSWTSSLSEAVDRGAVHLSLYQLSLEEGCFWHRRPPDGLPDGYPFYRWSQWYLPRRGFEQYEIASFSRPGASCRHNVAYWTGAPVVGLGAGAWGCVEGERYRNAQSVEEYERLLGAGERERLHWEPLPPDRRAREAAVLLLRTADGIDCGSFASRYGDEVLGDILATLSRDVPGDCLAWRNGGVALSPRGMRVGNAIWSLII